MIRTRSRTLGGASRFTVLALLLFAPAASAQPPTGLPPNTEETQLFRGLLHFHKIEPESLAAIGGRYDYAKLIVVVYGPPGDDAKLPAVCRSALARGGAVLIACDTKLSLSQFFPRGGKVSVHGGQVFHEDSDGLNQDRPFATPRDKSGFSPFTGIGRVATNATSYLQVDTNGRPAGLGTEFVAEFPPGVKTISNGQWFKVSDFVRLPFALATTDDSVDARFMALADQDVFSNRMIYTSGRQAEPTDNLRFANATVQWLKGTGRTRCLFVQNGTEATAFDEFRYTAIPATPPIPPPNVPNINVFDEDFQRKLADAANQAVDAAQQNDVMNQGILAAFGRRRWLLFTVLATALAFLAYGLIRRKAIAARVKAVFRPIPQDPAMLGPDVPVGSIGHRKLELLRSADYGPVVRPVVRQLFQDRGLPSEHTGDRLPPLDIDVRRPQFLKEAIHSLWAILKTTAPIGYGRWKQLEPLLAAVRAAADDDRWRFAAPTEPRDAAP